MQIEVGKRYKIQDGGTIKVQAKVTVSDDPYNPACKMRCTTETGEVVFYDEHGRVLPLDGGKELRAYNVVGEVHNV